MYRDDEEAARLHAAALERERTRLATLALAAQESCPSSPVATLREPVRTRKVLIAALLVIPLVLFAAWIWRALISVSFD
jgi:hypothetical protein